MNEGLEFYLVDDREVAISAGIHVCCDGGQGPLGHPREYMTLERSGEVQCNYCGRRFLHVSHPEAAGVRDTGERLEEAIGAA